MLASAGAAATAVAAGAFKYNRANYFFDSGLRFARYTTGYGYAQEQAALYREDIRDLTNLTVAKQDSYHGVAVLFFVLNFQLIMAGRLGVHGPSPPGWLLSIYWVNISSALMFLCVATWLTLHASARATAGSVHMLTRSVRIPIPSPKQLDKARKTGNSFEKQRVSDVFRVPFVVPAPKDAAEEAPADDAKKGAAAAPPSKTKPRRMPKWFQDETKELQGGTGAPVGRGSNPEHFELYRGLAQEWAGHDCYARIGLIYWMSSWLTSVSLYSQCHCFTELRAIWPAWTVTPIFCMAHFCVLQCEITEESHSRLLATIPLEKIVPWTPMIVVVGMTIDYSTLTPNDGWIAVIYLLSWSCYIIHFLWACRQYELAMPHPQVDQPESTGHAWYPAEWWLPRAFSSAFYIVAPPKQLEPGQNCILQEMKASKDGKGAVASPKKAREVGPMLFPWRLFRGAMITYISVWALIMFGRVFEQVNGERQLLKQEGRVMRWPSHMQPWMTPWTRNGTRTEYAHSGGSDRRLHELAGAHYHGEQKVAALAERLAASLGNLAEVLDTNEEVQLPAPMRAPVSWPSDFKPAMLASKAKDMMLALTQERHGVMIQVTGDAAEVLSKFALEGPELGELMAASWSDSGLLVTTKYGAVAECTGLPVNGVWPCKQVAERLPTGGSSLKAAVVARTPSGLLRAAVTFTEDEGVVLLEADIAGRNWTPSGEVQLSQLNAIDEHHFSFSADGDELIISSKNGAALKWRVGETQPEMVASPKGADHVWHCACAMRGGRLAHLASTAGSARSELLLARRA
mmetsp:Transcript_96805/g.172218  ORF Transcript_96805/g.172218 Transcript_96805/m.172218 type:complete len:798 (+) Transcript_96805:91-2484(+)